MRRSTMIKEQLRSRDISDPAVLHAMAAVRRDRLIPPPLRCLAYEDGPLPIGSGQTISQPYIVALMTQLLHPRPDHRMLEIGTGSGYQAAVLAEIVAAVYTVEILPELAAKAAGALRELGYGNIFTRCGDGADGWPEAAPFDGIIITAATPTIPTTLKAQLKPGGRLIVPLGFPDGIQTLTVMTAADDGWHSEPGLPVRFVPLTGRLN